MISKEANLYGLHNLAMDLAEDSAHFNFVSNLQSTRESPQQSFSVATVTLNRSHMTIEYTFIGKVMDGWMDGTVAKQWVKIHFHLP